MMPVRRGPRAAPKRRTGGGKDLEIRLNLF